MNKARRKRIETIVEKLTDLRAELDDIQDEERTALDSLPENMQSGEKAEKYEEVIDQIQEALDDLDQVTEKLNETIQ